MPKRESAECPKCHKDAIKETSKNPIRNVVRVYLKCRNCDYERLWEEPA